MTDSPKFLGLFDAATQLLQRLADGEITGAVQYKGHIQIAEVNLDPPVMDLEKLSLICGMASKAIAYDKSDKHKYIRLDPAQHWKAIGPGLNIKDPKPGGEWAIMAAFMKPQTYANADYAAALESLDFLKTAFLLAWKEPADAAQKANKISVPPYPSRREADMHTSVVNDLMDVICKYHGVETVPAIGRARTVQAGAEFTTSIPRPTLVFMQKLEGVEPGREAGWAAGM